MALTKVDISLMDNTGTTANKLLAYDGSGNLPAVDGSQLTNVSTATVSASDPTVSTNPAGGVGTEWQNTTSGEVYICTDATAGENVWTNVGAGTGDVVPVKSWQAATYIYNMAGFKSSTVYNTIERISVTSDGDAADWADLNAPGNGYGSSSDTHGYMAGGYNGVPPHTRTNRIEKYPFASQTNGTDIADILYHINQMSGFQSATHGYLAGGNYQVPSSTNIDVIQKYTHATDANATDVGNCLGNHWYSGAGIQSETNGYSCGGIIQGLNSNDPFTVIQKVSFSSDGNSTDAADMTRAVGGARGCGTDTYGYICGGYSWPSPGYSNIIEKFSYSSEANSTDVADLLITRAWHAASSSATYGYNLGGESPATDSVDKFLFATDANATDVGNLTRAATGIAYTGTAQY